MHALPQVLAYHAKIGVRSKSGKVSVIKADLPDFEFANEILGRMGRALQVRTAGEVVEAIGGDRQCLAGCTNCSIDDTAQSAGPDDVMPVVDWDHEVVT